MTRTQALSGGDMKRDRRRPWATQRSRETRKHRRSAEIRLYVTAFLLTVGTFCLVFFWPSDDFWGRASVPAAVTNDFSCRVSSITDGDTLRCADGTRVRLHAVAARESDETCRSGHPCPSASAAAATAKLAELADGQTLRCDRTGTSYERAVAICWNEADVEINCAMVESGTALLWPRYNAERAICGR